MGLEDDALFTSPHGPLRRAGSPASDTDFANPPESEAEEEEDSDIQDSEVVSEKMHKPKRVKGMPAQVILNRPPATPPKQGKAKQKQSRARGPQLKRTPVRKVTSKSSGVSPKQVAKSPRTTSVKKAASKSSDVKPKAKVIRKQYIRKKRAIPPSEPSASKKTVSGVMKTEAKSVKSVASADHAVSKAESSLLATKEQIPKENISNSEHVQLTSSTESKSPNPSPTRATSPSSQPPMAPPTETAIPHPTTMESKPESAMPAETPTQPDTVL